MKILKKILIIIWAILTLGLIIYSQQLNVERKFRERQYQKEHEMLKFARDINIEYYKNFLLLRNDTLNHVDIDSLFDSSEYLTRYHEKAKSNLTENE